MNGWVTYTLMRKRFSDGTEFAIRPAGPGGCHLTVTTPAGLKAHSYHPSITAAQDHAEDMMVSFTDPVLDDYRDDEPAGDQLELA